MPKKKLFPDTKIEWYTIYGYKYRMTKKKQQRKGVCVCVYYIEPLKLSLQPIKDFSFG